MTTVFHSWPRYGRFMEIKQLQQKETSQSQSRLNFLGGSCHNRDNVRASTQFRRESEPQHLKRLFFHNRPIHFCINSTNVIRLIQVSFSSIEINKPLSSPVYSVSRIRFKFRSQFQVIATDQMPDRVESSIISIDSKITDNIT